MKNEETGKLPDEHRQTYVGDGVTLEIITTEVEERQWMLSVVNEMGISSNWNELFETKDCAIEAALDAIREEGVGAFQDMEDFEYLLDDYSDE